MGILWFVTSAILAVSAMLALSSCITMAELTGTWRTINDTARLKGIINDTTRLKERRRDAVSFAVLSAVGFILSGACFGMAIGPLLR